MNGQIRDMQKQKYNNTYYLPQKQITSMKSHNTQNLTQ